MKYALNESPSPIPLQEYEGFKRKFSIGCRRLIEGRTDLIIPIDYLVLCLFLYRYRGNPDVVHGQLCAMDPQHHSLA